MMMQRRRIYKTWVLLLILLTTSTSSSSSRIGCLLEGTLYATAFPLTTAMNSSRAKSRRKNFDDIANSKNKRNNNKTTTSPASSPPTATSSSLAAVSSPLLIQNPLWNACGIYLICDVLGFVISVITRSHVHLDLIGTGAFAMAALGWPGIKVYNNRVVRWSSTAVAVWGGKLALFLFGRASKIGHDSRLSTTLSTTRGMFDFWAFTGLWQWCLSLPFLLGRLHYYNNNRATTTAAAAVAASGVVQSTTSTLSSLSVPVGAIIYVIGLIIETLADAQKWYFKQSHASNEFCNVGLWKISQHPNFFGNLLLWVGILIMNLPALITTTPLPTTATTKNPVIGFCRRFWKLGVALIGPWFSYQLFLGQAKGTFLNSVSLAQSKYGHDPNYATYLKEVPLIFPRLSWNFLFRKR